jgi:hypothetical protein
LYETLPIEKGGEKKATIKKQSVPSITERPVLRKTSRKQTIKFTKPRSTACDDLSNWVDTCM